MHVQNSTSPTHVASLETHRRYRIGLAYGYQVYRIRWLIIAFWFIALITSIPFADRVASVLTGGGFSFSGSESTHVDTILTEKLHQPPAQVLVIFQSATTPVSDPGYQQEINNFIGRTRAFPHVSGVIPGGIGQDGRTTFVTVNFNTDPDAVEQQLPNFHTLLPKTGPARAYLTGNVAVYSEFAQIAQQDTEQADARAIPIALAVLLVVFGTLIAALIPIVLALVAVPVALAVIYAIALHNTTNVTVLSITSIVGLGISIDYSLFLTRRFREELAHGRAVPEAVAWTIATAGEAILFSAMTVMIGFAGLMLIGIQYMTSIGLAGTVVVGAAMIAALTLLPALLSVLGLRINALRIPFLSRFVASPAEQGSRQKGSTQRGFWHAWALAVMQHPIPIILAVSVLLLSLGWPVLKMRIGTPDASSLPVTSPARQGLDILHAQFPMTKQDPIDIIVQAPDGSSILTATNLARLAHLTQWIAAQPHITSVTSLTRLPASIQIALPSAGGEIAAGKEVPPSPGMAPTAGTSAWSEQQLAMLYTSGAYRHSPALAQFVAATTAANTTLITATADTKLDSPEGIQVVDNLRTGSKAAGQGLTVLVGGFQAISLDFNRYLYSNFPRAILFILLTTFVLLLFMFHSLLLPLKAVLMNLLSISASYGVLVYVFQWGHFEHLLGFTSEGFVESTIPILMFCILFGLSMDYEVFLLSRIREEWLRTQNNRYAVAQGLERTGGVITNAALILMIVTGAITFTTLISTKEIGLGMTIAVFMDATIIRSLLVPATMRLLGRWNWWLPGFSLPAKQGED
jgi:RND superfamily putative drug exporter